MSRVKLLVCAILLIAVGGCSLVQPFIDRRRDAGASPGRLYVGMSQPDAPVVCYNSLLTKFDEIKKLADEECQKHKTGDYAEAVDVDYFTCRIMTPNAYRFKCVKSEDNKKKE